MFNPMKDIQSPDKKETDSTVESSSKLAQPQRSKQEEPTPSQVGRFLSALDRNTSKGEKKLSKAIAEGEDTSSLLPIEEESEDSPNSNKGLFGLIQSTKKRDGSSERVESYPNTPLSDDEELAIGKKIQRKKDIPLGDEGTEESSSQVISTVLPQKSNTVLDKTLAESDTAVPALKSIQRGASSEEESFPDSTNPRLQEKSLQSPSPVLQEKSPDLAVGKVAREPGQKITISQEQDGDADTPYTQYKTVRGHMEPSNSTQPLFKNIDQRQDIAMDPTLPDTRTPKSRGTDITKVDDTNDESDIASLSKGFIGGQEDPSLLSLTTRAVLNDTNIRAEDDPSVKRADIIQLIDTITAHVVTLKAKDLTSTQILLKNPPTFAGATLTIQEYSAAKNEFSIVFTDLSPDARRLIESTSNQELLHNRLLEHGYTLRMVNIESGLRFNETQTGNFGGEGKSGREGTKNGPSSGRDGKTGQDTLF